MLVRFLKAYVKDSEKSFLTMTNDAHIAWNSLRDCHKKQGPITQVHLIQELLSISYPKDVSTWSLTTDHLCDICTWIFAQAVPTFDILFMVAMLNALECEADHIRGQMTSYYVSNQNASLSARASRIEQEAVYKTRCEGDSSESALTACSAKPGRKSTKICSNPQCSKTGHLLLDCFGKGGPMEGKYEEVLAAKAKAREERNKAKETSATLNTSNGVHHNQSG